MFITLGGGSLSQVVLAQVRRSKSGASRYTATMNTLIKKLTSVAAVGLLCSNAFAQSGQSAGQGSETDPVYLFNEVCYTQVPDVAKIKDMAKRFAWGPMGGDDLQRFTTIKTPSLLEGWDIRISERIYRLGIVQSPPSDSFIASFPDMADGTATSCTLVLDGRDDAQILLERLNAMVGKAPTTADVPDDLLLTTTWSGGNDTVKVFVFYKTDALERANLMNVTIVTK